MFSKATEYALRATIYIAQKSSDANKIGLDEIAKAIDSPASFTAKILQALTKDNKIVRSARGPKGGFYMTEKSKKLPAKAILKVMGEDEVLEKCVLGLKRCTEKQPCPMHTQYKTIKQQLMSLFTATTIEDLATQMEEGALLINNKILPLKCK